MVRIQIKYLTRSHNSEIHGLGFTQYLGMIAGQKWTIAAIERMPFISTRKSVLPFRVIQSKSGVNDVRAFIRPILFDDDRDFYLRGRDHLDVDLGFA
jgi:hypothetical protein